RHLGERLEVAAQADPGLCAITIDLNAWLDPAWIIERSDRYHGDARHEFGFLKDGRPAFGTKAAVRGLPAVAGTGKDLDWSGDRYCGSRQSNDHRKRAAGLALTVFAMADTDESGLRRSAVAHGPTRASAGDLGHRCLLL